MMDNANSLVIFLDDYGILISAALLTFGWFVIFNGTKYITSRNEAKSYVKDYTDLITSSTNESFEFWANYSSKELPEKNLYFKKNKIVISKLNSYLNLLLKYGLKFNLSQDMIILKKVYTLAPDNVTLSDQDTTNAFLNRKVLDCEKTSLVLIKELNNSFTQKYPPTVTPILHILTPTDENSDILKGTVYGFFIVWVFFAFGRYYLG